MPESRFAFNDRFLPNQGYMRQLFQGSEAEWNRAVYRLIDRTGDQLEFKINLPEGFSLEKMSCASIQMDFLKFLIRMGGYRTVLEIGTFVGFSALHLASALPPDGQVTTIEKYELFADCAQANFQANGMADRIELLQGDALQVLKNLDRDRTFDLIFIDAHKECYRDYLVLADQFIERDNGLIVVDDVFFLGDVLNEAPGQEKGRGVLEFVDAVLGSAQYWQYLMPIGNGMMLIKRRSTMF
ncbi:MAG: O-methyltransferase [Desulfobacterales bacterium]|nr:O-methyltransferase [Desulfobacterales bacterium]